MCTSPLMQQAYVLRSVLGISWYSACIYVWIDMRRRYRMLRAAIFKEKLRRHIYFIHWLGGGGILVLSLWDVGLPGGGGG
jgi:hypothetical protein